MFRSFWALDLFTVDFFKCIDCVEPNKVTMVASKVMVKLKFSNPLK